MGKYERYNRRPEPPRSQRIHPIWRGIGCLIILILPPLAFALAALILPLMKEQGWLPYSLLGPPRLPAFLWRFPVVIQAIAPILGIQDLYALILLTLVMLAALTAVISFIYAVVYALVGPPRYSPVDAPPPRWRIKKYRR